MSRDEIKKDVDNKFLLYLSIFLDFQIEYFSKAKKIFDIETTFIILLCALNTTAQLKKETKMTFNSKYIFTKLKNINNSFGLNATSIAEITKIPRTTVLRKIEQILKLGILEKDKFKRYSYCENSKDYLYPVIKHTMGILGLFFIKYLEIYLKKA
jgi:Fic family protein